jgi:hypothetical protein
LSWKWRSKAPSRAEKKGGGKGERKRGMRARNACGELTACEEGVNGEARKMLITTTM